MSAAPLSRAFWALLLAAAAVAAAHAAVPEGPWSGRSVADALRELSEPGLDFLFSSELVPEELRVREANTPTPTPTAKKN